MLRAVENMSAPRIPKTPLGTLANLQARLILEHLFGGLGILTLDIRPRNPAGWGGVMRIAFYLAGDDHFWKHRSPRFGRNRFTLAGTVGTCLRSISGYYLIWIFSRVTGGQCGLRGSQACGSEE